MENLSGILSTVFKVVLFIIDIIGLFKLYGKIGAKKWIALIPFVNEYCMFKAVYTTKIFWIYLVADFAGTILTGIGGIIPSLIGLALTIVVLVIQIKYASNFAKAFDGGTLLAVLTFLFPAVVYLICGYSNKYTYSGNKSEQ